MPSAAVRRRLAPDVLDVAARWEAAIAQAWSAALADLRPTIERALRERAGEAAALEARRSDADPPRFGERELRRVFAEVDREQDRALRAQLPGVAIPDVVSGGARLADRWARANVDLIRVEPRVRREIEEFLRQPLREGVRVEQLRRELDERFALGRRRAQLIARDQTLKLAGQLQEERQTQVGIRRYVWTTSGDERVRDDHADLDGTVQEWSDPPVTNASEVVRGRPERRNHPGGDFQCRCTASPVLDDDELEPEEQDAPDAPEREPDVAVQEDLPFVPEPVGFSDQEPVRAPRPAPVPVAEATPAQLVDLGELERGRGLARPAAEDQASQAVAAALPGRSLADLRAIPFDATQLAEDASLTWLRQSEHFRRTGNVPDVYGSSRGGLPQVTIEWDGRVLLGNGRHRLTVARELGLRSIVAHVRKLGPRGGLLWSYVGHVLV